MNTLRQLTYNLALVGRVRDKLQASGYLNSYIGKQLNREQLAAFVKDVAAELDGKVAIQTLYESCAYLAHEALSLDEFKVLTWRIAGNMRRLTDGEPVPPWQFQAKPEWMPVQFLSAVKQQTARGKEVVEFQLCILAGTACAMTIAKVYASRFCFVLAKQLGFSNSRGSLPYFDSREFIGLRANALFVPELSEKTPQFDKLNVPGSLQEKNRRLIRARRRSHTECPQKRKCDCLQCPIGCDSCPFALRPQTLKRCVCSRCGKAAWLCTSASPVCDSCRKAVGEFFTF
jgi:hypothetical protein